MRQRQPVFGKSIFEKTWVEAICDFHIEKMTPTVDKKLKSLSTCTNYEFPYGRTNLYHFAEKISFLIKKHTIER